MVIHPPQIKHSDGEVTISSRIEMSNPVDGLPDRLWFTYPEAYTDFLSGSSDGFAASLLLTAMYFGEDLEIRGSISPRLLYGLGEYQQVIHTWFPKTFRIIEIHPQSLQPFEEQNRAGKVGTAFSGGVDSLYSLWSNLPDNQPLVSLRVTHGLLIHGFDIRLYEKDNFSKIQRHYQEVFRELGLELITARTNGFLFWEFRVDWNYVHGGLLIGTALNLEKLFTVFYVPSTHVYQDIKPLGTSPLLDHLLSTENLTVIHFGASTNTISKLKAFADWEVAHEGLRVCTEINRREGVKNCSRCNKCLRTIFMLEILGVLPKFKTFRYPFRHRDLLHWIFFSGSSHTYPKMLSKAAKAAGRWDIALPVLLAIPIGYINGWITKMILNIIPPTMTYRLKRKLYGRLAEGQQVD